MAVAPAKLGQLNKELESIINDDNGYKQEMRDYRDYYQHSAMYKSRSGVNNAKSELRSNLLRIFADKLIHYTSPEPITKVPTTGADDASRQSASIREKIIYAVRRKSNTALLRREWAFDADVMSMAVAETRFNLSTRCAEVRRYDPRHCYWQHSNDNDQRLVAFWAVYPISKTEAQKRYGVTPTKNLLSNEIFSNNEALKRIDGEEWFLMAIRWDDKNRSAWVGDQWIEEPHNHMMGIIPIDICTPFYDGNLSRRGSFFLEPLIPLQAELNETIKQRANIVRRMANPVIWGRGIISKQFDEVKRSLKNGGGGFVGLKQGGDMGVLTVSDTTMLKEHSAEIMDHMMKAAGFGLAAFGDAGGANSSGDALAMSFNPTQKLIDHVNIAFTAFDEAINAKILMMYDKFLKTGEQVTLTGYSASGTLEGLASDTEKMKYKQGGFEVTFDKSVIAGNYTSIAIPKPITPRDELAMKRLLKEAVDSKLLSRTTALEEWGILSPEDELSLLRAEQQDPSFNDTLLGGAIKATMPPAPGNGLAPVPTPSAPSGRPAGYVAATREP